MSSVAFHTKEETVRINGRERAYYGVFINNLFNSVLDLRGYIEYGTAEQSMLVQTLFGHNAERLHTLHRDKFQIDGETWNLFECALNTALVIGSPAVKFMVRVHAQCEIHAYVLGENREWLAVVIEQGLRDRVLRRETQGYGKGLVDLVEMLRATDEGPVVMSYSVCNSFPPYVEEKDEHMTFDEGMEWLLTQRENAGLEIAPDPDHEYHFGDGKTAFDLKRKIKEMVDRPGFE